MIPGVAGTDDFCLRAEIGLDRTAGTTFTVGDCSSMSPAALYGCGKGGDGAPYRSVGDFETAAALEDGLGYAAIPAVRLEALLEYRPRFTFEGRAIFLEPGRRQFVAANLLSLSGKLAAYVNLPAFGLPRLGPFAPFMGAGVGAVRIGVGETHTTHPRTATIVPGARRNDFAWMAAAGVTAALDERTMLDLA